MATNLMALARKLQTALAMRGRRISINHYQAYSEKAGRMVTKFVLTEKNARGKNQTIFESWRLPEVVMFLAGCMKDGGGDG